MPILITTKFLSCTDTKGERIKATVKATIGERRMSVTLPYDYSANSNDNHIAAAKALLRDNFHNDNESPLFNVTYIHTDTGLVAIACATGHESAFKVPAAT